MSTLVLGIFLTIGFFTGFITATGTHNKWCEWKKDYEKLISKVKEKTKGELCQ